MTSVEFLSVDGRDYLVGSGYYGLLLLDVSDPPDHLVVNRTHVPSDISLRVDIVGRLAYVAVFGQGMAIVDYQDPEAPLVIGFASCPGRARDVVANPPYAYLADDTMGVQVIDIADPAAPHIVASIPELSLAVGLALEDSLLFVADYFDGLHIVNVSDPLSPFLEGSVALPGPGWQIAVSDTVAYVAMSDSGLAFVDIRNPSAPQLLNRINPYGYWPSGITDVAILDSFAYLSGYMGLGVYNVKNPLAPSVVQYDASTTPAEAVAIDQAKRRVATAGGEGLALFDLLTSGATVPAGVYSDGYPTWWVEVQSHYLYVSRTQGIEIYDITDPTEPVKRGVFDSGYANDIAIRGDYVYLAHRGIEIVDVSDPDNPFRTDSVHSLGWTEDVDVVGDFAYLADGGSGFTIVDIADKYDAKIISRLPWVPYPDGICVKNDRAYLACATAGLVIVSVSDPYNPYVLGSVNTPWHARACQVRDTLVYIADTYSGLIVVNAADPTNPRIIGQADTPERAFDVALLGDYAFVADNETDLQVVDISDPADPRLVDGMILPGRAWDVAVSDPYVYLASQNGLLIFHASIPTSLASPEEQGVRPVGELQNYPNPFNPVTTIRYSAELPGRVDLVVYDVLGRVVRKLVGEVLPAGIHESTWLGQDQQGLKVSSGVYFYRLYSGGHVQTGKMLLLR